MGKNWFIIISLVIAMSSVVGAQDEEAVENQPQESVQDYDTETVDIPPPAPLIGQESSVPKQTDKDDKNAEKKGPKEMEIKVISGISDTERKRKKSSFLNKMNTRLESMNKKIQSLDRQIGRSSPETQNLMSSDMSNLEQQTSVLRRRIESGKSLNVDNWGSTRSAIIVDWSKLNNTYRQAMRKFKRNR